MNKSTLLKDRRIIWILLGGLSIFIRFLAGYSPEWTEKIYTRGLFPIIRTIIDYTFTWIPIPLIYVFIIICLFFLSRYLLKVFRATYSSIYNRLANLFLSVGALLGGLVFFFLFLWGYNYARIPIEQHFSITADLLTPEQIKKDLDKTTQAVILARSKILDNSIAALDDRYIRDDFERAIRADVIPFLQSKGFKTPGKLRGRSLKPKGVLLRISTSGFYFPFVGECHIDAGLHPVQKPFVMAHEYMHGYGFTDEGTCNFLAYLACKASDDPFVRYSGYLNYWRYLAIAYKGNYPKLYAEFRRTLPEGIVADLNAINETMLKYPDILPELRDVAYDTYLKSQGVKEGLQSYSRIILLVHAYNEVYE